MRFRKNIQEENRITPNILGVKEKNEKKQIMARKKVALLLRTEHALEKGVSTVSIGAYAAVLAVLEMDTDLEMIALDEEGKQRFKENNLKKRKRATPK